MDGEPGAALLSGLPAEVVREVRAVARVDRCRDHATLFRQGDAARSVFVLLGGRIKVVQDAPDGREMVTRFIAPGELFGCVPLLGQEVYPGTASAVEPSELLAWPAREFESLMVRHPTLAKRVLVIVGDRLREFQGRLREVASERVEQRIARALLRLARQMGTRTDTGIRIELALSRAELAGMTGTTVYSASRILSDWRRRGIVSTERRRLVVHRPHELVAIAEDLAETRGLR